MTSKIAKVAMASAHTAGIYADMTVDGPEIGTLVVIVDRAKNLPNRKTMGKQDPYCAARLGKEAKKTETDRRGGQTPRWDQELRFTVHESPDYYQLKISVFNDDKKTDLIGETWVPLEDILKPGGGQSDKWHGLNCKGRYAGDIQLELTFWDSRPKDEEVATKSTAPSRSSLSHERSVEGLGGPRQPGAVKRRPLPADPVSSGPSPLRPTPEHTQSAPLPQTSSRGPRELNAHPASRQHAQAPAMLPSPGYDMARPKSIGKPQLADHGTPEYSTLDEMYLPSPNGAEYETGEVLAINNQDTQFEQYQQTYQYGGVELPKLPPKTPRTNRSSGPQAAKYYSHRDSNSSPAYALPQYSTPREHSDRSGRQESARYSGSPLPSNEQYQQSPIHQNSFDDYAGHLPMPEPSFEPESPPPPPPAHRSSGIGPRSIDDFSQQLQYSPAPLNLRGTRSAVSASPLSYNEGPDLEYRQPSPVDTQLSSRSAPMPSTYDHPDKPRRHSNLELDQYSPQPYGVPTSSHHREQDAYGRDFDHSSGGRDRISDRDLQTYPATLHQGPGIHGNHPDERNARFERRGNTHQSSHATPPQRDLYSTPDRRYEWPADSNGNADHGWQDYAHQDPRTHQSSAPLIKPHAVSPEPRAVTRKSVSPQPPSLPRNSGLTGAPFSPDSYNQLNPNLSSAGSINSAGPKYNTPEGAREARREWEKEEKLATDGPIIGSDGKVIDPSDHLPSDTWAPEPERKIPRKTHEIKLKFRHSPQSAQPMPPSAPRLPREPATRHSLPNPSSDFSTAPTTNGSPIPLSRGGHENVPISPINGGRNRLQKRSSATPRYPESFHSSPTPAAAAHYTPSAQPPPQAQDMYPLRERASNYDTGYLQHSSPFSGASAPPIPAKVPLGRGQEDWDVGAGTGGGSWYPGGGVDRLSEELRGIDIGGTRSGPRGVRIGTASGDRAAGY